MSSALSAALGRRSLMVPVLACITLNAANLAAIAWYNPSYLRDYRLNPNPDAPHYVLLGRNLFLHGEYSRNEQPPYVADIFRTPAYPVFAGGLDLVGGADLIYAAQSFLHLVMVIGIYKLADSVFGERAACIAGLIVAIHPTLIFLNVQAMSETLFDTLLVLGSLALVSAMADARGPGRYFLAGTLIGLATLVRPAGLYLPLALALFVGVAAARTFRLRDAVRRAAALALGAAALIAPWIVRNAVEFGLPSLTTNDTVVLVYFTGAGAYQEHYGVDRETAAGMIQKEFGIHSAEDMWNYHNRGLSPAAMDREARRVIVPVLTRYPADLCRSSALGLVKAFFSHDAGMYSSVLDLTWARPGAAGLLKFDRQAWSVLMSNHPLLIAMFVAPFVINGLVVVLAMAGVVVAVRRGSSGAVLVLLLFGFFAAVCAASGVDAYTRFAAPALPFAAVLAGAAAASLSLRRRPPVGDQRPAVHGSAAADRESVAAAGNAFST